MKSGGHFNCWTEKKVNELLQNVTGGDATVEKGWNGARPKRDDFPTFKDYLRASNKVDGYVCKDSYRPGAHFWGKTPRAAAVAAGFTLIN